VSPSQHAELDGFELHRGDVDGDWVCDLVGRGLLQPGDEPLECVEHRRSQDGDAEHDV
jgi:hypothetical protein